MRTLEFWMPTVVTLLMRSSLPPSQSHDMKYTPPFPTWVWSCRAKSVPFENRTCVVWKVLVVETWLPMNEMELRLKTHWSIKTAAESGKMEFLTVMVALSSTGPFLSDPPGPRMLKPVVKVHPFTSMVSPLWRNTSTLSWWSSLEHVNGAACAGD